MQITDFQFANNTPLSGAGQADAQSSEKNPFSLNSTSDEKDGESATSVKPDLTPDQQRKMEQLKSRDRAVRAHEAAHMAAAAGLVRSGASFSYQTGPDGQRYAVGGEVSIDTSSVANNPEATLAKASQIQAAALAPADPSAQDRAVAASAARMAMEARIQLAQQQLQSMSGESQPINAVSAVSAYESVALASPDSVLDKMV